LEIAKKIITNNPKVEPIFSLLERKYDVPLIEAEYKLEAVAAETEVAAALKVRQGSPIFRIERTSYSKDSRPHLGIIDVRAAEEAPEDVPSVPNAFAVKSHVLKNASPFKAREPGKCGGGWQPS
jgi:hypothetical protein